MRAKRQPLAREVPGSSPVALAKTVEDKAQGSHIVPAMVRAGPACLLGKDHLNIVFFLCCVSFLDHHHKPLLENDPRNPLLV